MFVLTVMSVFNQILLFILSYPTNMCLFFMKYYMHVQWLILCFLFSFPKIVQFKSRGWWWMWKSSIWFFNRKHLEPLHFHP